MTYRGSRVIALPFHEHGTRRGEGGWEKGEDCGSRYFSMILHNSELVNIYCKYDEILDSRDRIVEGPSHLQRDDVSSSNAFPQK
jgi:hypothetical protein